MCGIFGQLGGVLAQDQRRAFIDSAQRALRHRGPDGVGAFDDGTCILGHTRLKILDLSEAAAQPMRSASGASVLTFNGEIYNFVELRRDVTPTHGAWRPDSGDTEVLLQCLEQFGERALDKLNGMFAFAWWRPAERELLLARDRLGEKPLYWTKTKDGAFRFASEIGALLADGTIERRTSVDRISEFLQYGYNMAPRTSFVGIESLPQAHLLRAKLETNGTVSVTVAPFWRLPDYEQRAPTAHAEWLAELGELLEDAVRIRLRSDVPFGSLLSGGVDSSIVSLLARRKLVDHPLKTVTIDFDSAAHSEARFAREVAAHIRSDHEEVLALPPTEADLENIVEVFGELHGDIGTLATFSACRAVRNRVTVALTGNGGDELMAGYARYYMALAAAERAKRLPRAVGWAADRLSTHYPAWLRGDSRLSLFLSDPGARYASTMRFFPIASVPPLLGAHRGDFPDATMASLDRYADRPPLLQMMAVDAETYIPGYMNVSFDRASMSMGLEMRAPFLDHRLFEHIGSARPEWLTANEKGKLALRELYAPLLPPAVFEREKAGFAPPVVDWLRGKRLEALMARIESPRARIYDVLDRRAVSLLFQAFERRIHNVVGRIWCVLLLETWLARWAPVIEDRG